MAVYDFAAGRIRFCRWPYTILPLAVRGFVMGERGSRDSAVFRGNAFVSMSYGYRIVPHMK